MLGREEQEQYEGMTDTQRGKVLANRSGRRHRTGQVPASYNKKKIPFVAQSVVRKLVTEIAPSYSDRSGGYTRIIRLPKRRIGDNSDLAILQLVGEEEASEAGAKKSVGQRRQKTLDRIRYLEGKKPKRSRKRGDKEPESGQKAKSESAPPEEDQTDAAVAEAEKPESEPKTAPESKEE